MTVPLETSFHNDLAATLSILSSPTKEFSTGLVTWADSYLKSLAESGAEFEIMELLRAGCKKTPLAATVKCGILIARLPAAYHEFLGDPKRLTQLAAQLETTAQIFDGFAMKIPSSTPQEISFGTTPGPRQMAAHLRTYQSLASAIPLLMEFAKIRNVRDIERHLPTAYVKSATSEWHDREVAALISAATGVGLDEGAHRVWRNRNFSAISLPLGALWDIIAMIGEAHNSKP